MKKPCPRLQVEELEGRTLLSGTASAAQLLGPALAAQSRAPTVAHLGGTVSGQYTTGTPIPDVGTNYHLAATGKVGTLGAVTVSGSLTTPGFILTGRAGGTLILTNAHGSVTLRLVGPVEKGFGPMPKHFSFTVDHGTGAYRYFRASGTIDLKLRPSGVPGSSPLTGHGTFTLTIHETAPPVRTGIAGIVVEGPISPVDRPGVPNTRPVPDAIIFVRLANSDLEIAWKRADGRGRFELALTPGVYEVVAYAPHPGRIWPRGIPQRIVVTNGHVIHVTLTMDTGIV
jgi:hypothetical protein